MQAHRDGLSVDRLFSSNVQYRIPIYQRRYVWTKANWSTLWEDIKEKTKLRIDGSSRQHFTGSIVAWPNENQGEIPKFEIIDGQQRLTTFQIILCVIRDICTSKEYSQNMVLQGIAESAERHVKNERHLINVTGADRLDQYKLLPTEHDETAFRKVVNSSNRDFDKHLIYKAYDYFRKKIQHYVKSDPQERMNHLLHSIIGDFVLVRIDLGGNDEPEKIFASLNATGKMLYEFDYLRNYLFLRAKVLKTSAIDLYEKHWKYFEESADYWDSKTLELFLWDFLEATLGPKKRIQSEKEENKRAFDLYREYSQTWGSDITSEFAKLKDYAVSYREIKDNSSPDFKIANQMQFYNDLKIMNLYPFLLFIVKSERLTGDERNQVFDILESYIVRWLLCYGDNEHRIDECRYARIDNFFSKVIEQGEFSVKELVESLCDTNNPSEAWPTNEEVESALQKAGSKNVNARLIVYILYRIEISKRDTPPYPPDAEVQLRFEDLGNREHIMPSKWSNHWPLPLCDREPLRHSELYSPEYRMNEPEWREKRDQIDHLCRPNDPAYQEAYNLAERRHDEIDSIGNITPLSPELNNDLSDLSFNEKKAILSRTMTNLQLSREILQHESWDVEQIRKRSEDLYKYFCRIWKPAEYFLKAELDKMLETEAYVFVTNMGERKLEQIEAFQDRVTGLNINSGKSNLQKEHILFACSVTAWQDVQNQIENRQISANANEFQVKTWLLESARDSQDYVKIITYRGHVLRGKIESFDDQAIYIKIARQQVIVFKHSMHEFVTEGRLFKRQIESFDRQKDDYGFITFVDDPNSFFLHITSVDAIPNGFDGLRQGMTVEFNVSQGARGLSVRNMCLVS